MQALWMERLHLWKLFFSTETSERKPPSSVFSFKTRSHNYRINFNRAILLSSSCWNTEKLQIFFCCWGWKKGRERESGLSAREQSFIIFFRLLPHSPFFCLNVQLFIAPKWKLTTSALFYVTKKNECELLVRP